ncbi:MAG: hypothetical protein ACQERK_02640 [Campylobacterota bacterium]
MNPKELKLIRLLIGFILVLLVLFALFILMAIPSVNLYKQKNTQFKQIQATHSDMAQDHESRLQTLVELKKENKRVINAFDNKFDEESFMRYLDTQFERVSIQKEEPGEDERFLRYRLKVTTSMQTPVKFYEFLQKLNSYKNIIQVEFPIEFAMEEGELTGMFDLKKYYYKIRPLEEKRESK